MDSRIRVILVTDLVASTELRAHLGEEAADQLLGVHDALLRESIGGHRGWVVKGLGDGVLACFDAAVDALNAAVAIQQALDVHGRSSHEAPLPVRIGLSGGDVAVDEDGDVFGIPVIEASRLCTAATGGQILAASIITVLARGRGNHAFATAGDLDLKGLPGPVPAVEVLWEPIAVAPAAGIPFPNLLATEGRLAFTGRSGALEGLRDAWKEAAGGRRRGAFLAGEPGIGKTRLASELARQIHHHGGVVLYGRCEAETGAPFAPFAEALGWYVEGIPLEGRLAALGRFPGDLVRLVPDLETLS